MDPPSLPPIKRIATTEMSSSYCSIACTRLSHARAQACLSFSYLGWLWCVRGVFMALTPKETRWWDGRDRGRSYALWSQLIFMFLCCFIFLVITAFPLLSLLSFFLSLSISPLYITSGQRDLFLHWASRHRRYLPRAWQFPPAARHYIGQDGH